MAPPAGTRTLLYVDGDEFWSDTAAAVVEADPYEEEADTAEIGPIVMRLCLAMEQVAQVRTNALAQLPDASDVVLVAALRYFVRRDAFMNLRSPAGRA
jgi:hypothetical protein